MGGATSSGVHEPDSDEGLELRDPSAHTRVRFTDAYDTEERARRFAGCASAEYNREQRIRRAVSQSDRGKGRAVGLGVCLRGGSRRRAPTSGATTSRSRHRCRPGTCRCRASSFRPSAQTPHSTASEPSRARPHRRRRHRCHRRCCCRRECRATRDGRARRGAGGTWLTGSPHRCCRGFRSRSRGCHCSRCMSCRRRYFPHRRARPDGGGCPAGRSCRPLRRRGGSAVGDGRRSGDAYRDAGCRCLCPPSSTCHPLTASRLRPPGPPGGACCPVPAPQNPHHRQCRHSYYGFLSHCQTTDHGILGWPSGLRPPDCFLATMCCPCLQSALRPRHCVSSSPAEKTTTIRATVIFKEWA